MTRTQYHREWQRANKDRRNAERRAKYAADKVARLTLAARAELSAYRGHLKQTYGLTLPQVAAIVTMQDFRCTVCGQEFTDHSPEKLFGSKSNRPSLDHDHKHAEFGMRLCYRSLLCQRCNVLLREAEARRRLQVSSELRLQIARYESKWKLLHMQHEFDQHAVIVVKHDLSSAAVEITYGDPRVREKIERDYRDVCPLVLGNSNRYQP